MFLYINGNSSPFYPNEFYLDLPTNLAGEIGLSEINFEFNQDPTSFDVCCDICEKSLTQEDQRPILRRIYTSKKQQIITFEPIHYVRITEPRAPYLKVYLRPLSNASSPVKFKTLQCTLHVRQYF